MQNVVSLLKRWPLKTFRYYYKPHRGVDGPFCLTLDGTLTSCHAFSAVGVIHWGGFDFQLRVKSPLINPSNLPPSLKQSASKRPVDRGVATTMGPWQTEMTWMGRKIADGKDSK